MKPYLKLFFFLFVLVGILVFSSYAHDKIESGQKDELKKQIIDLEARLDRLRGNSVKILKKKSEEYKKTRETLVIVFPESADQINAIFDASGKDKDISEEVQLSEEDSSEEKEETVSKP